MYLNLHYYQYPMIDKCNGQMLFCIARSVPDSSLQDQDMVCIKLVPESTKIISFMLSTLEEIWLIDANYLYHIRNCSRCIFQMKTKVWLPPKDCCWIVLSKSTILVCYLWKCLIRITCNWYLHWFHATFKTFTERSDFFLSLLIWCKPTFFV